MGIIQLPHSTCTHLPFFYTSVALVVVGFCDETLNMCGSSEDIISLLMGLMTQYNGPDKARMSLTKLMKKHLASINQNYPLCAFSITNIPIDKCCSTMSTLQHLSQPAFPFPLPSWMPSYCN